MTTLFTEGAPVTIEEYLTNFRTRVLIGKARHYASLSVSGGAYAEEYDWASIGLQTGTDKSFDVGLLGSISSTISAEFEAVEVANVPKSGLSILSEETATVALGLKQWDPNVIDLLIQTGEIQDLDADSKLLRFGGQAYNKNRPMELFCENISKFSPTSEDIALGLTAIVITFYDGYFSGGLTADDLQATGQPMTLDCEYVAEHWNERDLGNQIGNIFMY